ncbi:hypothetical protein [uncultured Acinetobacter sp.]|uniref:hypothetical protein n=1 Tax=uncultured Acinetobacter sp. TaxID=165433 RepID=UPI0025F31541|nr:hypothetical protein [uncultured Acinetobacter sp.]
MKYGICKLCDKGKELKKSHVIGRAVFRKALMGSNYALRFDPNFKKVVKDQDQWATYMLCGDCEHKLNSRYETYALNALRNRVKSVKHKQKNEYFEIQGIDQTKLNLYLLSIVWRGIESNHEVFEKFNIFNISPLVKKLLKDCINNERLYRSEFFNIRVSKLVNTIETLKIKEIDFITNFSCNIDEKKRIRYLIIFEGYSFEFFFLTDVSQIVSGLGVLKKNKRILKMPYIDVFSIPEFRKSLLEMLDSQKIENVL